MNTLYFAWENHEDPRHRVLHIFPDHVSMDKFVTETNGLPWWSGGARYCAKDHEIENHDPNLVISHTMTRGC